MKDEIKEILKILKKCEFGACITKHNSRVLLDYITNLQEENMKLISENETIKNIKYTVDETIYKSRNEKAIKFIEEKISSTKGVINDYLYHKEHNKILIELLQEDIELYKKELNILQGEDDK